VAEWPDVSDQAASAGASVTLGLLGAWVLHDAEELVMVPRWLERKVPELRERFPDVPDRIWRELESMNASRYAVAIGVMGLLVAAAAVDGYRTGGRSPAYQAALLGFGLHGVGHVAQAAAVRGYTPGAATSPLVVIPFALWARGRLKRAGVMAADGVKASDVLGGVAMTAGALAASHVLARIAVRGT
jgi:hypothetical protein